MAERMPWSDALALLEGAMACTLRGDEQGARAAVALIPASMLRGSLVALVEAFAEALLALPADREAAGLVLADAVAQHLLAQGRADG